jgi:tryptophan-rich sensory protein
MHGAALTEIVLLWLLILATTGSFWPISRAAGWPMAPYLSWVGFAATLNYAVWRSNA